ncbi:MAG: molybdopterin molybdotransferase MoeA [Gemmatimonadaceae bacterium]
MEVGEACEAILRDVAPLETEAVPLREALGRVIAEDVYSPLALPPWDNASMDGYAVRSEDIQKASANAPTVLKVLGTVAAGESTRTVVGPGEAIRIMTGAPVPGGADSVVRVEDTDAGQLTVRVLSNRDALRNVRPRGEDMAKGGLAVAHGEELHAGHLGLLASVGRAAARVHRRPRVAVLASGDELVDVDRFQEVLDGMKIVTSNSYSLEAAVREAGAEPVPLGFVGDDPVALRERLADHGCDLLLTTGGVSVGEFDYTRSVLAELGATMRFWRVRIRPGAPLGFGLLGGAPWIGLPGNPVSTLVTFELFARPAIRRMLGHSLVYRRPVRVRLAEVVTIAAPLTHFLRAELSWRDGALNAKLTGPQGSGLLTSMARADALLVIPANRTRVELGEVVEALLLRDRIGHAESPSFVTDSTA